MGVLTVEQSRRVGAANERRPSELGMMVVCDPCGSIIGASWVVREEDPKQAILCVDKCRCDSAQWQPIETAPVGESVLIYIPNADHYGEGIYRALLIESDYITNPDGSHPRHWQTAGLHIGRDCLSQLPTHWMPLPDPPEVKQ